MPSALPMDRRNPSIGVRRCAGKILIRLAEGPATSLELVVYTVCEKRTVDRALDHIRTWDIGLVMKRPVAKVRGSREAVYSLEDEELAGDIVTKLRVEIFTPLSTIAAVALALESA